MFAAAFRPIRSLARTAVTAQRFASTRFAPSHEWVKADGNIATVGITDYAQSALGDVVYLSFPNKGDVLAKGESFGSIESVKATSDLYAPVDGEVVEVNTAIEKSWSIVNTSPQDKGWIVKLKMSNPKQLEALMDETAYKAHLASADH